MTNKADDIASVIKEVRYSLSEGQIHAARNLIDTALEKYPANSELLRLRQIIAPGRVERLPNRHRSSRQAELNWIARNRHQYLGKWVALVDDQAIAIEDDAKTLLDKIGQQDLSKSPLIHHLA